MTRGPSRSSLCTLWLLAALLLLGGCVSLPSLDGRSESTAVASVPGSPLHEALQPGLTAHPGLSGFYSLSDGEDAFAARIVMIDAAVRSLDVQYYIWRADVTGRLMFDALRRAAARGVQVRLLLDDNNTQGLDPLLAALAAQPNIEIRLFNPFRHRRWRPLGFLTDFARLNRRMHNKSLTVDGAATLVGGRNIGNEYFDAGDSLGFIDLDVVAIGPIVAEVARSFDAYWRSDSAYPVDRLLPPPTPAQLEAVVRLGEELDSLPEAQRYLERVRDTRVMRDVVADELPFEWATAHLVVDDPAKGLGQARRDELLTSRLEEVFAGPVHSELLLVSPYFVPGREGTQALAAMAQGGATVKVLTNALESTDVTAVHSGYAKRRRALLKAGVELWELRREVGNVRIGPRGAGRRSVTAAEMRAAVRGGESATAPRPAAPQDRRSAADRDTPAPPENGARNGPESSVFAGNVGGSSRLGSSDASLHAKTFAVDGKRLFIGSFNFDLRSALYNTELGIVIDSPDWARSLQRTFERRVPEVSYRVQLDAHERLEWMERHADGKEQRYDREPNASAGRKLLVLLLGLLPIEGLL